MTHLRSIVLVWLALSASTALAHPDVDAGKAAFLKGEFRPALARLEEAERSPNVTEEDLVNIHWYRGASYYALGKKDEANKSFDELLAVRPLFTPNKLETPPDVRGAFKKRSDVFQKAHGVTLGAPALEGATLNVPLDGNTADAAGLLVYARAAGEKTYRKFDFPVVEAKAAGVLNQAGLWERSGKSGKMELVIEVLNARGTPIARAGDALKPLSVPVTEDQSRTALTALQPAPQATAEKAPAAVEKAPTSDVSSTAEKTPPPAALPAPPKDEPKASPASPLPMVLGAAGAGLLALGALGALGFIAGALGSGASWGSFVYVNSEVSRVGAQVGPNYALFAQLFLPLQVAGYALAGVAGVGIVTALLLGGAGVVTLILRVVLG